MNKARSFAAAIVSMLVMAGAAFSQDPGEHPGQRFWLPARASNDPLPVRIDFLFDLIMWIVTVAAVVVFALLLWFLFKYRGVPGRKAVFLHGNHKLELIWTLVPAGILIWLGFTQVPDWNRAKVPSQFPKAEESTLVQVEALQFDWNFRQPGIDGKFETYNYAKARAEFDEVLKTAEKKDASEDDKQALVEFNPLAGKYFGREDDDDIVGKTMTVPVNKPVLIELRSIDVIHSFFIPVMRVKQDAVPGKPMPVWFRPTQVNAVYKKNDQGEMVVTPISPDQVWEIACAQLCGNNHTTMRATINVVSQADYDAWVKAESEKAKAASTSTIAHSDTTDIWSHWCKQGTRPAPGGELTKPWNEIKIAKQQALKGEHEHN